MRIIYFGTPALAVPPLDALCAEHEVVSVVTQPDRPRGRSGRPEPPEVKVWAGDRGIPVHQPAKLHDGAFAAWLAAMNPDLCCVAAYGRLLKQPVLDVPSGGWLNLHPSLLPRWRGPSPIQTALLEGDEETGVTIMRMVLEMDAGDIVLQERTPIAPDETAGELTERLAAMGARAMVKAVGLVERDAAPAIPQDPDKVTFSALFEKEHGRIDWHHSTRRIHNQVRACNPWPVAHCLFRGQPCRIFKTEQVADAPPGEPGEVVATGRDFIYVAAGDGALALLCLQLSGKKVLEAGPFLRGARVQTGERFEAVPCR